MHLPPPSIGIENMSVGCPNDVCYGNVVRARACIWVHVYMACVQGIPWDALYLSRGISCHNTKSQHLLFVYVIGDVSGLEFTTAKLQARQISINCMV